MHHPTCSCTPSRHRKARLGFGLLAAALALTVSHADALAGDTAPAHQLAELPDAAPGEQRATVSAHSAPVPGTYGEPAPAPLRMPDVVVNWLTSKVRLLARPNLELVAAGSSTGFSGGVDTEFGLGGIVGPRQASEIVSEIGIGLGGGWYGDTVNYVRGRAAATMRTVDDFDHAEWTELLAGELAIEGGAGFGAKRSGDVGLAVAAIVAAELGDRKTSPTGNSSAAVGPWVEVQSEGEVALRLATDAVELTMPVRYTYDLTAPFTGFVHQTHGVGTALTVAPTVREDEGFVTGADIFSVHWSTTELSCSDGCESPKIGSIDPRLPAFGPDRIEQIDLVLGSKRPLFARVEDELLLGAGIFAGASWLWDPKTGRETVVPIVGFSEFVRSGFGGGGLAVEATPAISPDGRRFMNDVRLELEINVEDHDLGVGGSLRTAFNWLLDGEAESDEGPDAVFRSALGAEWWIGLPLGFTSGLYYTAEYGPRADGVDFGDPWEGVRTDPSTWQHEMGGFLRLGFGD